MGGGAISQVKVMPISLAQADFEASLLLLICKIILNPCAVAFPSPQARLVVGFGASQPTLCSEPRSTPVIKPQIQEALQDK